MTKSNSEAVIENVPATQNTEQSTTQPDEQIRGRGVFATEITSSGVAVSTAFLSEDGRVFPMPAIFPDLQYALSQIEELRQMVTNQFSQMAQVGAQVIAAEMAARTPAAEADAEADIIGESKVTKFDEK